MTEIILSVLLATVVSTGLIQFLKKGTSHKVLTIIFSIIITVLVSLLVVFIDVQLGNFSKFGKVFIYIVVPILSLGFTQFSYQFIAKFLVTATDYLKSKLINK